MKQQCDVGSSLLELKKYRSGSIVIIFHLHRYLSMKLLSEYLTLHRLGCYPHTGVCYQILHNFIQSKVSDIGLNT